MDEKWKFLDHFEYIEQKTSRVSQALFGLMPNLRGPKEKKRRLYGHVLNSIINYGAPIWSDATTNPKIKAKLMRIQRMMAIRIICGYRTISADAALLLARMPPTFLAASYYKRVFLRAQELKRNDMWSKSDEKEIKKEEMILLKRQWEIYLQRENVAGVRTCRAILPVMDRWLDRKYGETTFHTTQLLTGHGCFYTYLLRIGKVDSAFCPFCEREEDSSEHTLARCENWSEERETLTSVIGDDLSLSTVVSKIVDSEECWEALVTFAETVMLTKEDDERERERQILDED